MRLLLTILFGAVGLSAQAAHTQARLVLAADVARPSETVLAGIHLHMEKGWHTYWRNSGGSGMPTTIDWKLPKGVTAGSIFWPVPEKLPDLSSVRVWIGAGDQDPIIPTSEAQRLVELLRSAGADVTIRFFNAGHGLTTSEFETAGQWLRDVKPSRPRR